MVGIRVAYDECDAVGEVGFGGVVVVNVAVVLVCVAVVAVAVVVDADDTVVGVGEIGAQSGCFL